MTNQRGLRVGMTEEQAGIRLREMYDRGKASGRALAAIHLFGITHAAQIAHLSSGQIVAHAGLPDVYRSEVCKGIALAEYVAVIREFP